MATSMHKLFFRAPLLALLFFSLYFFGMGVAAHPHGSLVRAGPSNGTAHSNLARVTSNNHKITTVDAAIVSSGLGSAHIINNCPFDVNSNIVHSPRPGVDGRPEEYPSVMGQGDHLSHPFSHDPGMGISWKVAPANAGPVQLEWTWVPEQGRTYWDLSMIDATTVGMTQRKDRRHSSTRGVVQGIAHAFGEYGLSLEVLIDNQKATVEQGGGNCVPVTCPQGSPSCREAYNAWDDWSRQHDCTEDVDLVLTLCG